MDKKTKDFLTNSRNSFYSHERKIQNFDNIDEDIVNEYKNKLSRLYPTDEHGYYYLKMLDLLKTYIFQRKITPEEAATIIIKTVDEELELYQIFEECNRFDDIIIKSKEKFHFYDPKLLALEKLYIKLNNLEDEYSFTKKKELK